MVILVDKKERQISRREINKERSSWSLKRETGSSVSFMFCFFFAILSYRHIESGTAHLMSNEVLC